MTKEDYNKITWRPVDCASNNLEITDIDQVLVWRSNLFVSHFDGITIYDITDPLDIRFITKTIMTSPGRLKVINDELYVFCEESLDRINISRIDAPVKSTLIEFPKSQYGRSMDKAGDVLYITVGNSIATISGDDIIHTVFLLDKLDPHFKSYPSDICCKNGYLYVAGRHLGLMIFNSKEAYAPKLLKHIKTGYIPTDIYYDDQRQSLFMVGNEDFIQVDLHNPTKPTRYKSVKLPDTELSGHYTHLDEAHVIVAGFAINSSEPVVGIIRLNEGKAPSLINKHIITDYCSGIEKSNRMAGCFYKNNYLVLISFYRQLQVFKIA